MKYKFYPDSEIVFNHIKRFNPHKEGGPRDALTHGISNVYDYLWTEEVEISLDLITNIDKIGLHLRNLKKYQKQIQKGSLPPAVIGIMNEFGKIRIVDGNHRVNALLNEGITEVKIYIGILPENLETIINSIY